MLELRIVYLDSAALLLRYYLVDELSTTPESES